MYICIKTDGNEIQVRIIWGREEISIGKDTEEALAIFIISYFLNIILFVTFTLFFKPFICLKDFIIIFFNMACIFPITFKQQTGKRKIASWLCHIQFFCDSRLKKTPTTDRYTLWNAFSLLFNLPKNTRFKVNIYAELIVYIIPLQKHIKLQLIYLYIHLPY